LKRNDQILIIFGTGVSELTGHQKIIQSATSHNVCSCNNWEKQHQKILHFVQCRIIT